jgi:hypothetical protein
MTGRSWVRCRLAKCSIKSNESKIKMTSLGHELKNRQENTWMFVTAGSHSGCVNRREEIILMLVNKKKNQINRAKFLAAANAHRPLSFTYHLCRYVVHTYLVECVFRVARRTALPTFELKFYRAATQRL